MLRRLLAGIGAGSLLLVGLAAAPPATAAPGHAVIIGSGSSWAANLVSNWTANVQRSGIQVNYSASGSARGRADLLTNQVDFAVSDLTFAQAGETTPTTPFAYVPTTAGAVSFAYNLVVDGVRRTDVRLSGPTLARIFSGRIRNWNDPAITADNHGHPIAPSLPIVPVIRADAGATSYHLTDWFSTQFPDVWPFADQGATADFPNAGGRVQAKTGSDGVVNYVRQSYANGAIGYVEQSYAKNAGLPLVPVANASRHFVPPDADNVSLSLQRGTRFSPAGQADLHLLYTDRDARVYPLSYYSYGIVPTGPNIRMTSAKRQSLIDFFGYALCQGQDAADQLGYAPLPLRLARAGLQALTQLRRTDPTVDITALAPTGCDNPTITHAADGTPSDGLAGSVPPPPACSAYDADPCRPAA